MTKTLNATFAIALVAASVAGGSAAFAGGDYYPGVSNTPINAKVDSVKTGSINDHVVVRNEKLQDNGPARGDYFQGVNKN